MIEIDLTGLRKEIPIEQFIERRRQLRDQAANGEPVAPINIGTAVEIQRIAYVDVPAGGAQLILGEADVGEFARDPDGFAARVFGLSRDAYRAWVALDGEPLCGAITKKGKPCRQGCGPRQENAKDWLAAHRIDRCSSHQDQG